MADHIGAYVAAAMTYKIAHFSLRWEFLTLCTANVRSLVPEFVEKLGVALGGYCADPIVPVVKDDYDDELNPREPWISSSAILQPILTRRLRPR